VRHPRERIGTRRRVRNWSRIKTEDMAGCLAPSPPITLRRSPTPTAKSVYLCPWTLCGHKMTPLDLLDDSVTSRCRCKESSQSSSTVSSFRPFTSAVFVVDPRWTQNPAPRMAEGFSRSDIRRVSQSATSHARAWHCLRRTSHLRWNAGESPLRPVQGRLATPQYAACGYSRVSRNSENLWFTDPPASA